MVMTIAKITAGDGYTYLTRHTARSDTDRGDTDPVGLLGRGYLAERVKELRKVIKHLAGVPADSGGVQS